MRRVASLPAYIQGIEDRKHVAGVTDDMIIRARNSGERRTPEKRQQLADIALMAVESGMQPLAANY
jgi:hypothetical protein